MSSNEDPRIYFAAERTLLSWIRTGVAIMAFGFVVARFGLFLSLVPGAQDLSSRVSPLVGAALVLLGAVTIAAGALEYRRYTKQLRPEDLPSPKASRLPLTLAWLLVVLGAILVFVLVT